MNIALPMPDLIGRLQKRLLAEVREVVEQWSSFVSALARWEGDHLLDNPTPELLADHKTTVERCLAFGRFLWLGMDKPDFPDSQLAEMVSATQSALEDSLRMLHSARMSKAESDGILAVCFPDES